MLNVLNLRKTKRRRKERPSWKLWFPPGPKVPAHVQKLEGEKPACPCLSLQRWCTGDAPPPSSPGRSVPGGVYLDASSGPVFRFVLVPRGQRTNAIFTDVRGAKDEDVCAGLSMLVSLVSLLFGTVLISFYIPASLAWRNVRIVPGSGTHSRHVDDLHVLSRLE